MECNNNREHKTGKAKRNVKNKEYLYYVSYNNREQKTIRFTLIDTLCLKFKL